MQTPRLATIFLSLALLIWNVVFFHNVTGEGMRIAVCIFHGLSILAFALGIQAALMDHSEDRKWIRIFHWWTGVHLLLTFAYVVYMSTLVMLIPNLDCAVVCPEGASICMLFVLHSKLVLSVCLWFAAGSIRSEAAEWYNPEVGLVSPWEQNVPEPLPIYSSESEDEKPPQYDASQK
jgi:hypothetical protein